MNQKTHIILLSLLIIFFYHEKTSCQNSLIYSGHVFKDGIKTVQLHKKGWDLSYPILNLNSNEKLVLIFDELGSRTGNYQYTFEHCDAGWNSSNLSPPEYMDGFPENQIEKFNYSFNTTVDYVNYQLEFPNENIQFRISGNYIIKVYEDYDPEKIVLTKRFTVSENLVKINARAKRPSVTAIYNEGQEVTFSVDLNSYYIRDPYQQIKAVVCQNNKWDYARTDLKPSIFNSNELIFNDPTTNVFPAGNEYRYFDIKSIRYKSEYIEHIDFIDGIYNIGLYPEKSRALKNYFYIQELNGRYYIDVQEGQNRHTDADYLRLFFSLQMDHPPDKARIYIYGELTNWECNNMNRMVYNIDSRSYELSLLLKQGFYNYEYVCLPEGKTIPDNTLIEGSHYETENDYVIYIYHIDPMLRYDKLIGVEIVNTLQE